MQYLKKSTVLLFCILSLPAVATAEEIVASDTGTLSLATNPQVMVYIDGARVGMSPIINRRLDPGEHRVSLLLILPSGNRLRADYLVVIESGRDTVASLDLAHDAPAEGEVRTLAPPPARPAAAPPPPTPPPAEAVAPPPETPPTGGGSWATSPGRPRGGPVTVAEIEPAAPPPPPTPAAPPPPPEPRFGLSRDLVREGMEAMRPAIVRCMQGEAGLIQVRLNIQPDGGVSDVEVQGAFRGTRIGDCIEQALPDEAAFPIYTGEAIPVVYPFRVVPE